MCDTGTAQAQAEIPKYRCHKEVHAHKIQYINVLDDGSALIKPEPGDEGYSSFKVNAGYVTKHKPQVGGYYVVYKDGYESFSPAKAFEDSYASSGVLFDRIWEATKHWDLDNGRAVEGTNIKGYAGMTGDDVRVIIAAIEGELE